MKWATTQTEARKGLLQIQRRQKFARHARPQGFRKLPPAWWCIPLAGCGSSGRPETVACIQRFGNCSASKSPHNPSVEREPPAIRPPSAPSLFALGTKYASQHSSHSGPRPFPFGSFGGRKIESSSHLPVGLSQQTQSCRVPGYSTAFIASCSACVLATIVFPLRASAQQIIPPDGR